MKFTGKVWVLGNEVGATGILPARYDKQGMTGQWQECAKHLFEDVASGVADQLEAGAIVVAGTGFGSGHAHYYSGAIMGSLEAGISAYLVEGIGGLFHRGCIDFGLPACVVPGITSFVQQGQTLEVDLAAGAVRNVDDGKTLTFQPVDPLILEILAAGGSRKWALSRVGVETIPAVEQDV